MNALLSKLAFNGYNVRYHEINRGGYWVMRFETIEDVMAEQLWTDFPSLEQFMAETQDFLCSGYFMRPIMWVFDNAGHCLYMNPEYEYCREQYYPDLN